MRQRSRRFLLRLPLVGAFLLIASLETSCHVGLHGFYHGHHHRGHAVVRTHVTPRPYCPPRVVVHRHRR